MRIIVDLEELNVCDECGVIFDKSKVERAQKKLEEISKRTKKPILSARIHKKKDGKLDITSVEHTGKK